MKLLYSDFVMAATSPTTNTLGVSCDQVEIIIITIIITIIIIIIIMFWLQVRFLTPPVSPASLARRRQHGADPRVTWTPPARLVSLPKYLHHLFYLHYLHHLLQEEVSVTAAAPAEAGAGGGRDRGAGG